MVRDGVVPGRGSASSVPKQVEEAAQREWVGRPEGAEEVAGAEEVKVEEV